MHGDVAGENYHCHTASGKRGLHGDFENARHLLGMRNELRIVAALPKERIRVRFLKVAATYFTAGDLSGDGQNRDTAAMRIIEAVDEVRISRAAASGAHCEFPGEVRFRAGRKGGRFFVADVNPLHGTALAENIGNAVERIAGNAIDAFDARLGQGVYKKFSNGLVHVVDLRIGVWLDQQWMMQRGEKI